MDNINAFIVFLVQLVSNFHGLLLICLCIYNKLDFKCNSV
jgi:hypothetical protein